MIGLIVVVALVLGLLIFDLLAWRYGKDSRDTVVVLDRSGRLEREEITSITGSR